jgi:hypothetical protein
MTVTRRKLLGSAGALSLLAPFLTPELLRALDEPQAAASDSTDNLPHDSPAFWNGFFSAVNPASPDYGKKSAARGAGNLADSGLETQYLHYNSDAKQMRYATAIDRKELADHDGDMAVSLMLNQYRPARGDAQHPNASQLRVDVTQNKPFMNLLAPLAWSAMASIVPDRAGQLPTLDKLGFKSDQVTKASSHILLTGGSGMMAVNISRAPRDSRFLKILQVMITGAKMAAPFIALPAVSVPAMATFSEAFSYWEDRTEFLLNGNLVNVATTQQAMDDKELHPPLIGLVKGDYLVVAKKDTDTLDPMLDKLRLFQGYLVHQDTNLNQQIEHVLADERIPSVTYATVSIDVKPIAASLAGGTQAADQSANPASSAPPAKSSSAGKGKGSTTK